MDFFWSAYFRYSRKEWVCSTVSVEQHSRRCKRTAHDRANDAKIGDGDVGSGAPPSDLSGSCAPKALKGDWLRDHERAWKLRTSTNP